jgi:transcriptional regulator with XRE-family HTH domain
MTFAELLSKLQADRTQEEMAGLLGISQPQLSRLRSMKRNPSLRIMSALVAAFPEHKASILSVFLPSDKPYKSFGIPISIVSVDEGKQA